MKVSWQSDILLPLRSTDPDLDIYNSRRAQVRAEMSKTCLKCGKPIEEPADDPAAEKYPACAACWKEWTTYAVMVMNEMRLDMSLPEHRKALRKYERMFFGLEKSEGEIQKNPEQKPDHMH